MPERRLPFWWNWPLKFTDHANERMMERGIAEVEIRELLSGRVQIASIEASGRWRVEGKLSRRRWAVIVEPLHHRRRLAVITVFRINSFMATRELHLNFIDGRPIAAYLSLLDEKTGGIARTEERDHGLLVDFGENDVPVGVEILEFDVDVPERLNELLKGLGLTPLTPSELRPLRVA